MNDPLTLPSPPLGERVREAPVREETNMGREQSRPFYFGLCHCGRGRVLLCRQHDMDAGALAFFGFDPGAPAVELG